LHGFRFPPSERDGLGVFPDARSRVCDGGGGLFIWILSARSPVVAITNPVTLRFFGIPGVGHRSECLFSGDQKGGYKWDFCVSN
jgi:hypothetical protein